MEITVSVTKSSHQDRGLYYLHLTYFFSLTWTLLFCCKIESCCDHCFSQQIRPITGRCSIRYITRPFQYGDWFQDESQMPRTAYSIQNVSLNMYVKFQSLLFYSELNKLCGSYISILKWVNLHCIWINIIRVLSFPKQWVSDCRDIFRTLSNIQTYNFLLILKLDIEVPNSS